MLMSVLLRLRSWVAASLVLLALGAVSPAHPTFAATVVGTGTVASCTEAALDNAVAGGGNITFDCGPGPVTITLTNFLLPATTTTIKGGGLITLSGAPVLVNPGTTVELDNVTVSNSRTFGGVLNEGGTLTIKNSTITNNHDPSAAGGISNDGSLTITNSTLSNNAGASGGIANNGGAHLTISNTTITGNTASFIGGGIFNDGSLTISGSSITANTAVVDGGGIYNEPTGTTATLKNTTATSNTPDNCAPLGSVTGCTG
jgi:hypothetical protein